MSAPTRRRFLGLAGTALIAGLAGCASSVPFVGGPPAVRQESGDTVKRRLPIPFAEETPTPFAALVVGKSGTQTHQVWVWNRTGERREIKVGIGPGGSQNPWFERSYDFEPESVLAMELRKSRKYGIGIAVGNRSKTVGVPRSQFDCNESATDVLVEEGKTRSQTVQTSMGCGGEWF
ncbi:MULTISPECIES: hypothetical protein [Halorussus]|uniref:hypothetical protein n=1 Tax=Halorussus TaxID=1070314 RepID=UPI00209DE4DB|nr:hypothetical protein [Halorussus vallis]USZ77513.1 hypothetical protein NGM07_09295 [Halorussus vallis]